MKRLVLSALAVCAAAGAGCANDAPVDYTIVSPLVEVFQGSISTRGSSFYSFVVGNPDPVIVTFASLTDASGNALNKTLQLGFGKPKGEGCDTTNTTSASPQLAAQISLVSGAGTFCVVISDAQGVLTDATTFAIRIKHS